MIVNEGVRKFLENVASSSPTPGGGSVAAMAGAIASSLGEMVCNLTIGKKKYADVEEEMKEMAEKCRESREKFLKLVEEDALSFNRVMDAFRKKKGIEDALKMAAETPLKTAGECISLLRILVDIAEKGNKNSISDAGVAALMAQAAFHSAIMNVRINIKDMEDMDYRGKMESKMAEMREEMESIFDEVMERVEKWL